MMILNEENYAKNIILGKNREIKSIIKLIGYIVRYNHYVLNKDSDTNYHDTVRWLKSTQKNFEESCYSNSITKAINNVDKYPFFNIDKIKITKSELQIVNSLDNLRAEKILFVLLCMAKQQAVSKGFTDGLVQYTLTEVCKLARISVPKDDREYILHNILKLGFLDCPKKNDTKCLRVTFINDDEEELLLSESDCQELAYIYLNWKNQKGYKKCQRCGRLFKETRGQTLCQYCLEAQEVETKTIYCVDCGKIVDVSIFNTKTCRCEECQSVVEKELKSERNARYYSSHKN